MEHLAYEIVLVLLAMCVGVPALTLLHELAHAVAAAALIGGRVTVLQGASAGRFHVSVWRLDLHLSGPTAPQHGWIGWALWGAHPDRWRHALATLAGPVSSAASAFGCLVLAWHTRGGLHFLLVLMAVSAGSQLVSTSLPVRYGRVGGSYAGEASDGLRFRRLLEGKPEPAPVVARMSS